jgi:hypothetical protein
MTDSHYQDGAPHHTTLFTTEARKTRKSHGANDKYLLLLFPCCFRVFRASVVNRAVGLAAAKALRIRSAG